MLTLIRKPHTSELSVRSYATLTVGTLNNDHLLVHETIVLETFASPYVVRTTDRHLCGAPALHCCSHADS